MRLSAEEQTNWMPRSLGSMSLRPGLQYIVSTRGDAYAVGIPFVYSTTQTAILELTDSTLRPLIDEAAIFRANVSTTVTNGDFSSGTGWTITETAGASGAISGGKLTMSCEPIDSVVVTSSTLTISTPDQSVEHALRIVIDQGPVVFRLGSTSGGDEIITQTTLGTGTHSLAFTPSGASAYLEMESRVQWPTIVDSVTVEAFGEMTLQTPWTESELPLIRHTQSGDIVYVACYGQQQYLIERRATRSWSIVKYEPTDGPFSAVSGDNTIKLSIDAGRTEGTLTASRPYFRSTHVGALFRVFTPGYNFPFTLAQEDCWVPAIRTNGVSTGRTCYLTITGTWTGTITVQKSTTGETSGFYDTAFTYTTNQTDVAITDSSDNTVVYVRAGFKKGAFTSGEAVVTLRFADGGGRPLSFLGQATSIGGRTGVARIKEITSSTQAEVDILAHFSSDLASPDWFEGEWSDRRGWPSAVAFQEGRLWFAGRDRIWGSISDAFSSFDPAQEGDSGPIQRSIGYGPVQLINWILPMSRMVLGTEDSEVSVKSSSFDEPLTPTNFTLKDVSTLGSRRIAAVKIDTRGMFVERSGGRLFELVYSVESNDYQAVDATILAPDLNSGNPITKIVVQRHPDTRVHCIRDDGTVAVFVNDAKEEVKCFVIVETDGEIEDIVILPGETEDKVYYFVKRVIRGATKRFIERMALERECVGGTLNKQADSFVIYEGSATTTISGLTHLENEEVVVWADGKDFSPDDEETQVQRTYTVSGGSVTLDEAVESAVVGLPYRSRFKSAKLSYAAQGGTALTQKKKVSKVGFILQNTHWRGITYGPDFDNLQPLPLVEEGTEVAPDTIHSHYDQDMSEMGSDWTTDSRICFEAKAPRPCTVLAAVIDIKTNG